MAWYCEVCGSKEGPIRHHCKDRAIAKAEARYRREELEAEDGTEAEPTFDDRLEIGFQMMSLTGG